MLWTTLVIHGRMSKMNIRGIQDGWTVRRHADLTHRSVQEKQRMNHVSRNRVTEIFSGQVIEQNIGSMGQQGRSTLMRPGAWCSQLWLGVAIFPSSCRKNLSQALPLAVLTDGENSAVSSDCSSSLGSWLVPEWLFGSNEGSHIASLSPKDHLQNDQSQCQGNLQHQLHTASRTWGRPIHFSQS